jgi:predicted nucleotidyltransferase
VGRVIDRLRQAKDEQSGRVYAILHSSDRSQQLISFGTVDSTSGKISVISKWNSTALVFVVGSLSAFDSASAQFYSCTL